ncbi:MAG: glycine/sarcosine/betaine reductase selenoprotein B family protein [Candidatus Geothermincolia bacterium]
MSVDSFKFMSRTLAESLKNWPYVDTSSEPIPWSEPGKPISEARVALVSSGGIYLKSQQPFDLEHERRDPLWGDPSYREIPRGTAPSQLAAAHLHYENSHVLADIDCMFPMQALEGMLQEGRIGDISPIHLTCMGYQPRLGTFIRETAPVMAARLVEAEVDVVLLSAG